MLESLDILIGFTVVMLAFSLIATTLVQGLVSLVQLRGTKLLEGVARLLMQLDRDLEAGQATAIAKSVLCHPLVTEDPKRLASVIQREELVQILLGLAAGTERNGLSEDLKRRLAKLLKDAGIDDPAGTLEAIRITALNLERVNPGMASHLRHSAAIIEEAGSRFVAGIHTWFDSTMDRVSQAFSTHVRIITVGVAIAIALAIQLDSVAIINRLAIDKDLRSKLVTTGIGVVKDAEARATEAAATPESPARPDTAKGGAAGTHPSAGSGAVAETTLPPADSTLQALALSELVTPRFFLTFRPELFMKEPAKKGDPGFESWNWKPHIFPGLLLSAVMLSLGAPFWFNWLKVLLSLRSALAEKEDDQRKARTESGEPPTRTQVAVKVTEGAGEQGDLGVVG